jgi:hypothetical protein
MGRCCLWLLWIAGVSCFIFGVVFDWFNFEELRKNDIEIEATGNKACDFALDKYHWTFMGSIICKMIFGFLDNYFGYRSICKEKEKRNKELPFDTDKEVKKRKRFETLSLLFNVLTSSFQVMDLLLLVLFSYKCLDSEGRHHVLRFLGDDKDDVIASIFGTAGIIFNLTIKKNILTILKALFCSDDEGDNNCLQKFLSVLSIILIFVCVSLAIALLLKLDN